MNENELMHYGVPGMKWGVRKKKPTTNPNALKSVNTQLFGQKLNSEKVIRLSKKGYAHVMSELATNITNAQRSQPTIVKNIGKHKYTFKNNFDNTFEIIDRKLIPGANTKRSKK